MNDTLSPNRPGWRDTPSDRPLTVRATHAHEWVRVGRTKFWQMTKMPNFPRPVVLGKQHRAYILRELEEFLANHAPRG